MSRYNARAVCAVIAIAAGIASCTLRGQSSSSGQSGQSQPQAASDSAASASEPSLTPLETVQYLNQKVNDEIRIPNGMDTGDTTVWPGFFAIEQAKGTLWWVRGAQTGESTWEIRYSSVQVDQLDPSFLTLEVGHGNYEKITINCKSSGDANSPNLCWHNWVANWDDQSAALNGGSFGTLKVARAADHQNQQILEDSDYSDSPLKKQILLFDGKEKQLIDVEPTKPYSELEIYLGAADSDTAQRVLRALQYLLKTMPASVTEKDPFGP